MTSPPQGALRIAATAGRRPSTPARHERRLAIVLGLTVTLVSLAGCASTPEKIVLVGDGQSTMTRTRAASHAATAYLAAVNASEPAWHAIDATITANGLYVHRDDLLAQVNADTPFLAALQAIDFPPESREAGKDLIAAVEAYDSFLQAGYDNFDQYAAGEAEDARLNDTRAQCSAHLRDTLHLPASTASLNRP